MTWLMYYMDFSFYHTCSLQLECCVKGENIKSIQADTIYRLWKHCEFKAAIDTEDRSFLNINFYPIDCRCKRIDFALLHFKARMPTILHAWSHTSDTHQPTHPTTNPPMHSTTVSCYTPTFFIFRKVVDISACSLVTRCFNYCQLNDMQLNDDNGDFLLHQWVVPGVINVVIGLKNHIGQLSGTIYICIYRASPIMH